MTQPTALYINELYFPKVAAIHGHSIEMVGKIPVVKGFRDYANLVKINLMFSDQPSGFPVDRTGSIKTPIKHLVPRAWKYNSAPLTLDDAMRLRVEQIESIGKTINLMWSGGIDSTAMVNAFLLNAKDRKQLRVLYSPYSEYEHKTFLEYLKALGIDTVDLSGTVYLDRCFDGIFVAGHSGDESHASLDESFLEKFGYDILTTPWKDLFWQQTRDDTFIEFSQNYFNLCGRDIKTVLEARWWFYINSKLYCLLSSFNKFWVDYPGYNKDMVLGFYDCESYERYVTHNLDQLIQAQQYHAWKQNLKDYSFRADGFEDYCKNKTKVGSTQFNLYTAKKLALKDLYSIFILEDGTRISTPGLPLFSQTRYKDMYRDALDYLWNEPD